ncbi:MAG: murein hydrolase activator EnvC family protein [Sulfuricaulis sp.]
MASIPNHPRAWRAGAAFLACLSLLLALACPVRGADNRMDKERLQKLRARIDTLQDKLNETRGRRDAVHEEVRSLERRIGDKLNGLRRIGTQLRANEKKLATLKTRAGRERGNLDIQQKQLRRQVYMAYVMGRQEYPKMLLNQQSPASVARVLTYYRYFNRARTGRIDTIETTLTRLDTLERQIRDQGRELQTLRVTQSEQKTSLETSRARRAVLLASLDREVHSRAQEIDRLRGDEKRLEQLIEGLQTVLPETPLPRGAEAHFAKLRGRLPLPTRGRIVARYGSQKNVGNLKWRGLFIAGHEGQDVIAVYPGRVVFADWLRGFGLLLILEHGDGYMTLYGHNQSLHKGVGDWVEAGEVIASMGSTGDVTQPGLYFEIRHNGEPRDPLIWCKAR